MVWPCQFVGLMLQPTQLSPYETFSSPFLSCHLSLSLIIYQGHFSHHSSFTWLIPPHSSVLGKVTLSSESLSGPHSLSCVVIHCTKNILYLFTHLTLLKFLVQCFYFPRMSSIRTWPILLTILYHGLAQCSAHSKCSLNICQVAKRGTKWMRREGRYWFVCLGERVPLLVRYFHKK